MKTKIFLLILFNVYFLGAFPQESPNLDGYKYIYVPTLKYNDGTTDKWRLSEYARQCFKWMGFTVLTGNETASDDLKNDPCLCLMCNITHSTATIGSNSVTLTCTNCRKSTVLEMTESGMGMTLYDDYGKAFLKIAKKLTIHSIHDKHLK